MKLLEENDWIFLNNIAYKVHSIDDCTKMRRSFLELLKLLIPYDVATFYLSEHQSGHLLGQPVGINVSEDELQAYTDQFEEIDYTRWVFLSAKGMAYRETDLLPDSVREETALYKTMYAPNNIHFSAQLSLVYNDVFLGMITLYRSKNGEDFSEKDLFILDTVKDHLAFRLFKESKGELSATPIKKDLNLSAYSEQFKLTQRESEVFYLLFGEFTDEQICNQLFIGFNTLKKHILSIYKKSGVKSRLQLFKLVNK
ncbi:MAG TPA: helix-turn-helix transcriptional regulator [Anaerovoracaceae bacterium]|nr:helix-turn-helix transcriptional regulator [Anaerovoracaceae bacterium]